MIDTTLEIVSLKSSLGTRASGLVSPGSVGVSRRTTPPVRSKSYLSRFSYLSTQTNAPDVITILLQRYHHDGTYRAKIDESQANWPGEL